MADSDAGAVTMCGPSAAPLGRGRLGEPALACPRHICLSSWLVSAICRLDLSGSGIPLTTSVFSVCFGSWCDVLCHAPVDLALALLIWVWQRHASMPVVHQFSDCSTVLTSVVLILPCARQAQPLLSIRTAVGLTASKLQAVRDLVVSEFSAISTMIVCVLMLAILVCDAGKSYVFYDLMTLCLPPALRS